MANARFDLFPRSPDAPGRCEVCVRARFEGRDGIRGLHLEREGADIAAVIDFDPRRITLDQIRRDLHCLDEVDSAVLDDGFVSLVVPVDGMTGAACERRIEDALRKIAGVYATASYASACVRLRFDQRRCPRERVGAILRDLGYEARFRDARRICAAAAGPVQVRIERRRAGRLAAGIRWLIGHRTLGLVLLGGVFLLAGFVVHLFDGALWARVALLSISAVCTSTQTFPEAIATLRGVRANIDVLMFVAAAGAAALGHYEEGAFLLFLFGLGTAGEALALDRARGAVSALAGYAPETATRIDEAGEREVPIERLAVDDRVLVRPFDRVPVDGQVLSGSSAVDQAPITGESLPVDKGPGDRVFAGTINGQGRLIVRVERPAGETTLARVIRLVEQAQASRSPTEQFTHRVERWYVPAVFVVTAVLIVLPPLLDAGTWGTWFYRSMAFLTAASPCALAIGTPAAVLCGIARAARVGVLVKGGAHLENLGRADAVAFDKTGTLTAGRPVITRLMPLDGLDEDGLLALAASIEVHVNHPLADAIVAEASRRGLRMPTASDVEQLAGRGARAQVQGSEVTIGRPDAVWAGREPPKEIAGLTAELAAQAATTVAVARDGRPAGVIALADEVRPESRSVIAHLRSVGVRHVAMLTGDQPAAARTIADAVGVDEYHADLLPEDKLRVVDSLAEAHGRVAMVGDGVNDAPALARASIGIAMGAAGADVAMETADVVLMGSQLSRLPEAIGLSRASRAIIAQNLMIAMGVILVVAPLAAGGLAKLGVAVLLHEGSTIVVVLNGLRLLRYRPAL